MSHYQKRERKVGRPPKIDATILQKLEDAFINGFTDEMACLYAEISTQTLYNYQTKNPKFIERKELLKKSPDLAAQRTLVKDLSNTSGARWWAEHKMAEFMPKSKVELGGKIEVEHSVPTQAMVEAMKLYAIKRRQEIREEARKVLID